MLEYVIDRDIDLTLFVGREEVPLEEWLDTIKSYDSEGVTRLELYDLTGVTSILASSDVRAIATLSDALSGSRPASSRTALVVKKPVHRWLARFYVILADVARVNWETMQFSSISEALRWLEADPEDLERLRSRLDQDLQRL